MKIRVSYTVEVSDRIRRAINDYYGKPGLASRKEVQHWFKMYGESMDDDLAELASTIEEESMDLGTEN